MCVYVVVAHSNKGQHNISARFDVTFSFNYYHSQIDPPFLVMRMGKMHFVPVCRSVFILARISIASVCKPRRHANKCRRQTRIAFIINSCDWRGSGHVAPTSGPAMVGDQICTENFVYDANQHKMLGHAPDLQLMYTV